MIASVSEDLTVKGRNVKERKEVFELKGHLQVVFSVCFSKDSSIIIGGSDDQTVKVWNVKEEKVEFTLEGHLKKVTSVCFNADNSMIASGSYDRTVKVWNVKERKEEFTLEGHQGYVNSVCFSPDGSMIASGSLDKTVKVWNVKERKEEFTLTGHSDSVLSLCFSADGSMIASGSLDNTVKVWNIKERKEESILIKYPHIVNSTHRKIDTLMIASRPGHTTAKAFSTELKSDPIILPNISPTIKVFNFPVDYAASFQNKLIAIRKMELIAVWRVSPPEKIYEIDGYPGQLWNMGFLKQSFLIFQNRNSHEIKIFDSHGKETFISHTNFLEAALEKTNLSIISIFSAGLYDSYCHYSALNAFKERTSYDQIPDGSYAVTFSNNKYSPLHLLCYLGETDLIKKLLKENNRMRIKIDYFNRSPIFYSILGKHQAITDLLLEYISQAFTRGKNELMSNFLAIEHDLPIIIENSSPSLCTLLDVSFSIRKEAPQFGTIIKELCYSSFSGFSFSGLADLASKSNTEPLNVKVSAFRLPETLGSEDSIDLLNGILTCKIKDIYKLPVIQAFLNDRWNRIRAFILSYTFLLWINLVCLIALVLRYDDYYIFTASFATINGLLTTWEILQFKSNGWAYFKSYWNLVDALRIITSYVWLILLFYEKENETLEWITVVLNLVRGITGFQAFETTRYYIRLISDSLISIKSFLLIFIYTTLAFGLLKIVTSRTDSDISSLWKDSFGMAAGNSDKMDSDQIDLKYVTFVAAIFLNIILMLNMIISILGDSFDEFQLFAAYYNGKEMGEVILEIETILSLFNTENLLNHLHTCFSAYKLDEQGWKGKVIDMRLYIENSTADSKKDTYEKFKNIEVILENTKESLEGNIKSLEVKSESNMKLLNKKAKRNKKSLEDRISSIERKLDYLITSIVK